MSDAPQIPSDVLESLSKAGPAWGAQDYATAKDHANEALARAQKQNSALGELGALHLLANVAFNQCNDVLSRELHEQVKHKSAELDYQEGVASSLTNLALIDLIEERQDKARAKYVEAQAIYEASGNGQMAGIVKAILAKDNLSDALQGIPRIPESENKKSEPL